MEGLTESSPSLALIVKDLQILYEDSVKTTLFVFP